MARAQGGSDTQKLRQDKAIIGAVTGLVEAACAFIPKPYGSVIAFTLKQLMQLINTIYTYSEFSNIANEQQSVIN